MKQFELFKNKHERWFRKQPDGSLCETTEERAKAFNLGVKEYRKYLKTFEVKSLPEPHECLFEGKLQYKYYALKDLKKIFTKAQLMKFLEWMTGQTIGVVDCESAYYLEDVMRFKTKVLEGKSTYFD